jgi:hypothetical protein
MSYNPNDPKSLRRFITDFAQAIRGDATFKDSAWLYKADRRGIQTAERPSREMIAFIGLHEDYLKAALLRNTLFVYWQEGDTEATVQIMPVLGDGVRELSEFEQHKLKQPFERIKLPFPPEEFRPRVLLVPPGTMLKKD